MREPLEWALVSVAGLLVLLVVAVVSRKAKRDRHEAARRASRQALREAVAANSADEIASFMRAMRDDRALQEDFLAILSPRPLTATTRLRLQLLAESCGLTERLRSNLSGKDPNLRGRAVLILGHLGALGASQLANCILGDADADVRLAAAASLALLANEDGASVLIRALAEKALPAPRLIERLGSRWALEPILEALRAGRIRSDGDMDEITLSSECRAALAHALGLCRRPEAVSGLVEMLRHGSVDEKVSAARALGSCGRAVDSKVLVEATAHERWEVRAQAAGSLGRLGRVEAVPRLEALMADSSWWVRAKAAEALARLGASGTAALQRCLAHRDLFVRDRAAETLALGKVEKPRVLAESVTS